MTNQSTEVTELLAPAKTGHPNAVSIASSDVASGMERLSAILDADMKAAIENPNVKVIGQIRATKATFDCPHCGAEVEGWMQDPRGRTDSCDSCKQPYIVAADATVSID